ncbi:hypothetical protein WICMUC_000644 [Wickerhamomyces mucosus]|uniref:Sugar phosphate transporter domain-containing protein n=1 Tax=Wickerhamomyces mucosus TaxID=1378264 RepID=A0A9P8PWZ6_9ASCO|nr:hypothetical protein WICMUC_000644 [Wickerhamomyces mucosus]
MITVQINTPQRQDSKSFNISNNLSNILKLNSNDEYDNAKQSFRPKLFKPSKSSLDLTAEDYERHFTLSGRNTLSARLYNFIPPLDIKIILACFIWYFTSAVSSNISKEILKQYPYPITLTECQFFIASLICLITISLVNNSPKLEVCFPNGTVPNFGKSQSTYDLIKPTKALVLTTLPMGIFQFIGHITSHKATSIIPVSIVHSIKALSPLTTVLTYKIIFSINYPIITYLTLIPLIAGVMMTCFSNHKVSKSVENFNLGVIYAFISMIIFVSQNIFAKKILTITPKSLPTQKQESTKEEQKFDKISILLYCSIIGFILTLPVYIISEFTNPQTTLFELDFTIISLLFLHGVTHFIQAMLAFHLIGSISTVNYSIANIMKRIVVIAMAMVWERENVTFNQGIGLGLTLIGLYCYDKWGMRKK